MEDQTLWIGGAALGALAIREAFAFALKFSKRNNNPHRRSIAPQISTEQFHQHVRHMEDRIEDKIGAMSSQIKDLHDWHAKTDQDGVPVWYVRRSLEEAIDKLADNIQKQTDVFSRLVWEIQQKFGGAPKSGSDSPNP